MMKNKKMSILAVLVMLVVVTAYSVSGTYARYTSTFTGSASTATVAKWAIELNDSTEQTFNFDLFKTIKDSNGSEETDVAAGLIAPGTKGEFTIKLANKSEVNAEYTIDFAQTGTTLPLEFKVNGVAGLTNITATPINMNGEATILVEWEWPFNATGDDTQYASKDAVGAEGDENYQAAVVNTAEVSATVTVNQVD